MGLVDSWRDALVPLALRPDPNACDRWVAPLVDGAEAAFTIDGDRVAVDVKLPDHWPGLTIIPMARALSSRAALDTGDVFLANRAIFGASDQAGVFDAPLRKKLVILMDEGVTVSAGAVRLSAEQSERIPSNGLMDLVERMRVLALALVRREPAQNDEAVMRIALGDPDPRMREAFARLADNPELLAAMQRRAAASDPAEPDGYGALVRHLGDLQLPADIRLQAATRLLTEHPPERVSTLPRDAWRGLDPDALSHTIEKLLARTGATGRAPASIIARHVVETCGRGTWPKLPKTLAELTIASTRLPLDELDRELLLGLLSHRGDAIRMAAGRAFVMAAPLADLQQHLETEGRTWTSAMKTALSERVQQELGRGDVAGQVVLDCLHMLEASVLVPQMPSLHARTVLERASGMAEPLVTRLRCALLGHLDPEVRRHATNELLLAPVPPQEIARALPMDLYRIFVKSASPLMQRGPNAELMAALLDSVSPHGAPFRDSELVVAFLDALTVIGDARQSDVVGNQLESPYDDVVLAAVKTLAAIGTERELPRLEPLSKGFFRSAAVKTVVREAMAAIVFRHGDSQGGLTLSEHDDSVGKLSLEDPPPRR